MEIRFQFKMSYLDQCEYEVFGHPAIKSVEEFSAPQHTLDYFRTIFNHTSPNSFENEILSRQGGVRCGYFPEHWTSELWEAYCAFKRERHQVSVEHRLKMIDKYGDDWIQESPVLRIPRPIFFNLTSHRWETEPWYSEDRTALVELGQAA
jgi:hypothetical protein